MRTLNKRILGQCLDAPSADRTAGFSLVEVMCAILILGIGLVGLTEGITAALRSSKESERQTAAALIAAAQIELLRAEGFIMDGTAEGQCDEGLAHYRWTRSIHNTTLDGLHEVVVAVQEASSENTIYELRTLLFEPPTYSALDASGDRERTRKRKERTRR